MKVRDLIIALQQIHNQEKQVYFGNVSEENEKRISGIREGQFGVYIKEY